MKKNILILLLLTLLKTGIHAAAPDKQDFIHLGLEQGLSQSSVLCILQDKTGFIWIGTKDGLNRFDGTTFRTFRQEPQSPGSLGNNVICSLYEDGNGKLWVGTDAGIYIYDPDLETFTRFELKSNHGKKVTNPVYQIEADRSGTIWFAAEAQGMFSYKPSSGTLQDYPLPMRDETRIGHFFPDRNGILWFGIKDKGLYSTSDSFRHIKPFRSPTGENVFPEEDIFKIVPDRYNNLYIGTSKCGLKKINVLRGTVTDILPKSGLSQYPYVRNVLKTNDNELWIATESGIYIYNDQTKETRHLQHNSNDLYSLSDNAIYTVFKDRDGGIWVGSYFGGIDYYPPPSMRMDKYYPIPGHNSINGKTVREFCEDGNGNIWIGSEDGGLSMFEPKTRRFTPYQHPNLYHNIHALCLDGDKLWIGTFSKGLCVLDLKTRALKKYTKGASPNSLNDNSIYSMFRTSDGDLYLGTTAGLNLYNRKTDDFTRIRALDGNFVFNILEDSSGDLWFASYNKGIYRYHPGNNRWTHFQSNPADAGSLPYDRVISIFEDRQKQLWFTTQGGGFCRLNPENNTFTRYNSSNGLPNDVVYRMLEDDKGLLWLTTNKGLTRFDPQKKIFKTYTTANGLPSNQFNYSSGIRASNGRFYFGSINGFIAFDPNSVVEDRRFPPVVLTDFFLFNKRAVVGEENSPLKKSITTSDEIKLKYDQNSFALSFATLSYVAPRMNRISYKLEGFDKEWFTASDNRTATYTNIPPGDYTFSIRSSNSLGEWSGPIRNVRIHIRPPFWLSSLAGILYLLLATGLTWYLIVSIRKRMAFKQQLRIDELESEKERELHRAKLEFFTNVTHEIRTPLTLIKGPIESILRKKEVSEGVREELNMVEKNTDRLLELTNQLLDFRKAEAKGFILNFMDCNVSELLRETYARFQPASSQLGLDFELNLPEKDFHAEVDKEALTKIISNLFNNALKFANSRIMANLLPQSASDPKCFAILVANDGAPIPDQAKEEIFKPFVQVRASNPNATFAGTGIGLPLSQSLAELHKGSLSLLNDGETCFCLELPHQQEAAATSIRKEEKESDPAPTASLTSDTIILLVEDDPEMMDFVGKQLSEHYQVLTAPNGQVALNVLAENTVHLVISDVTMPLMDGFELCRALKSDLAHSHIPFVLLTARTSLQSKIEGIETGADSYIEKPFSIEYLLARVANLLSNQEKRRKAFESMPFVESKSMAMGKSDEAFLEKLSGIIHKNLSTSTFNVDLLAEEMNMSRSSLHRKIKGISTLTPNDFIQLERLKKAAQLIQSGEYRINEICYIVGFSSASYFTKCFQKQFGVLPKDFGKRSGQA